MPNSLLFLGRPGVGKTTVIREMARVLSDELHKRVVIVDTSNEIGGDGDVPHPAIGGARRMQVPDPSQQHRVMVSTGLLCILSTYSTHPHQCFTTFTNCLSSIQFCHTGDYSCLVALFRWRQWRTTCLRSSWWTRLARRPRLLPAEPLLREGFSWLQQLMGSF